MVNVLLADVEWKTLISQKPNMSDLFKSAFGYFSTPNNEQYENSFVGQIIEISNVKLKIKRVIAEGILCRMCLPVYRGVGSF